MSCARSALKVALALALPGLSFHAVLGQTATEKTSPQPIEKKTEAKSNNSPSSEQQKRILLDALKRIQSMADASAKDEGEFRVATPGSFAMMLSKDLQADVIRAIGVAQAKLGDLVAARTTWQLAADATNAITSIQASTERAELYIRIAAAQLEADDRDEARFTLRQALQSVRSSGNESRFPFEPPPGMEFDSDPLAKKAELLRRVAEVQAKAADPTGSEASLRMAIETVQNIKNPLNKVRSLVEIARSSSSAETKAAWAQAFDVSMAQKDEYDRALAVGTVLRARLGAGQVDEAMAIITDRIKGDLQNYAFWVFADAVASSEKSFPPASLARIYELALKAEFDRPSKKLSVFRRIAEAQARLGEHEAAYRTIGEPHPVNNVQTFDATQARAYVMTAVAEAQLKAKKPDAAKFTVDAALEMMDPLPDEDAEAYFPLAELGDILARAGDVAGALRTVDAVSSSSSKVQILTDLAVVQGQKQQPDKARATIRRALDSAARSPNDAVWMLTKQSGRFSGMLQGVDPMVPLLQLIAQAQAKIGDVDGALKTVAGMNQSTFANFTKNHTIDDIVSTSLAADDIAAALRAVELIQDSMSFLDEKADKLERIAKRQAEHGDPYGVLDWSAKQRTPRAKLQSLRGLADGIAQRSAPKDRDGKPPG
jgi:tetratricopeptide (TPR) repeat protein